MTSVRIELDRAAVRAVALTSPEVRAAVKQVAENTANRARSMTDDEIQVHEGGRSRARAYVVRLGDGARGEAEDRALGRSVGG